MECPYCSKIIHFRIVNKMVFSNDEKTGFGFFAGFCPSEECQNIIVVYKKGLYFTVDGFDEDLDEIRLEKVIYPITGAKKAPPQEVPEKLKEDYIEASTVLQFSPKASAALSRRCLQNFFHIHLNIKERNLGLEIEKFLSTQQLPSYIIEAIDAIRNLGNIAAHPTVDKNTGEIVDVEPGEAEWLLEVLEYLFDLYFVQPAKMELKKQELNRKLIASGKPPMK